jgi:hypothetical protein
VYETAAVMCIALEQLRAGRSDSLTPPPWTIRRRKRELINVVACVCADGVWGDQAAVCGATVRASNGAVSSGPHAFTTPRIVEERAAVRAAVLQAAPVLKRMRPQYIACGGARLAFAAAKRSCRSTSSAACKR